MEFISKSEEETRLVAEKILAKALKTKSRPVVLALCGELGAGKTTFVKKLADLLGVKDEVRSPTFLLIREFKVASRGGPQRFVHVDAYRIGSAQELIDLGLKNILQDPQNIVVVEWAERVEELLPAQTIKIRFEIIGDGERKLNVENF